MLEALAETDLRDAAIVFPSSSAARDVISTELGRRGARVEVIVVYDNVLPPKDAFARGLEALSAGQIDAITFSSASTVHNFAHIVGADLHRLTRDVTIAAIGPETARACRERALNVDVMPDRYTIDALLAALAQKLGPKRNPLARNKQVKHAISRVQRAS